MEECCCDGWDAETPGAAAVVSAVEICIEQGGNRKNLPTHHHHHHHEMVVEWDLMGL